MKQDTLLLIDGFNLLSRGYFATAYNKTEDQIQKSSKGQYTNALRIFFQKLFNLINDHGITHLAVAWDVKREDTSRRQKYDFYKASRNELPLPLIQQYETLKEVLNMIGIKQLEMSPYEADDIIGTLSTKWTKETQGSCLIYSNDKDLLQLLNQQTSQIIAKKKEEIIYTINHFKSEYGIDSKQWIDVKALLGDKSDNIPGCPGVGEKSALPLVQEYHSVEELFEKIDQLDKKYNRYKKKLTEGRESVFISKELATIFCEITDFDMLNFQELKLALSQDHILAVMEELELKIKLNLKAV
ncbi:5'-3' exonuclease H3TH domain-containing protein [Bacillus carboniphilus]|uniref:5'-3' exonuclease n=1 Tax=Bacillus carboniphilus TaxID=86663 RepID=A0ABY9K1G3_9BACI|nr:5'-3' exonuclease H3TH domain-containing protein [Bacillus carboniphilus]WLR43685.1 5'-3' exonuclease H3TH domain-containing protein [Bacillus carboniphilus]